ncbi:hypothetical protein I2486_13310 [Cellulophaga sp. E16_2]|nr:hypothetical protein [Cellulophaga sp. E16_2]MBO0592379.1 hypothetical protein [Cellulophaga sp. E16_2]
MSMLLAKTTYSQAKPINTDTISGLYLTKSYNGFTGDNYETLILKDTPSIYLSDIKEVSQNFNYLGKPAVQIVLTTLGSKKLKAITTEFTGEPLVIYFGTKIVLAPTMMNPITGGQLEISSNLTLKETDGMVRWLRSRIGN